MKISVQWLKDYLDFSVPPARLADRLSMLGLEVASVEDLSAKYENYVVGEVLDVAKHPNADRLRLCAVSIGKKVLSIVCGAPNVAAGQKVAVALVGATIHHNQHDPEGKPFVLEATRIRGVGSEGMICSSYELDLGSDKDGILILPDKARVGMPLARNLGYADFIYDIEVTANRGDWLSHIGVAREIGVLLNKRARLKPAGLLEGRTPITKHAKVRIRDTEKCRRYCARVLRNVRVGQSPEWLKERLVRVGVRPINCVVDVTNFVMLETGQPLHAFDYDKITGHEIIVQCATDGEKFRTLDGKIRALRSDILMICDPDKPVAIAGIMGGANTEIGESTTNILLEGANFEPLSIKRASKFLCLATDASQRFERSVDPAMSLYAVNRAAQLIQSMSGAETLGGVIDVYPGKIRQKKIALRISRVNAVLGTRLAKPQILSYLRRLELTSAARTKDVVVVDIPSFRSDLAEEIDLIEEVARVHGYDRIETRTRTSIDLTSSARQTNLEDMLRQYLVGSGFHEVVANSMQDPFLAGLGGARYVEVLNPISKDMSALRTSLVPGMMQIVVHNVNHGTKDLRLFEFGRIYHVDAQKKSSQLDHFVEEDTILVCLSGKVAPTTWDSQSKPVDVFDVKGELESLLSKIFLDKVRFIYYPTTKTLTEFSIDVEINKTYVGYLGKISEKMLTQFDLKQDVYVAEISAKALKGHMRQKPTYRPVPRYPSVVRDLAFVVDADRNIEDLMTVIQENGGDLVHQVELFDLFAGEKIETGKKSCAFTVEFLSGSRTLTEKEVETVVNDIVSAMQRELNARLRD